ncbi:MAG: response regulator transcription factor [Leptothrix sp. (in: b-proteobacteria)]
MVKVLVVDDSKAVQRSFSSLIAPLPHVDLVGCAEDVGSALALIDAHMPDLIVLDVELRHGERGIDLLRHVARWHPAMLVIVLSNFTGQAMRKDLLSAGALAYFDKSNEFTLARDWIAARAVEMASEFSRLRP